MYARSPLSDTDEKTGEKFFGLDFPRRSKCPLVEVIL